MSKIQEVAELVEKGRAKKVAAAVQAALDEGCKPDEILNQGMIGAMDIVGEKFKNNEIFVPEMLIAAKAMKNGVDVSNEAIIESYRKNPDTKIIALSALLTTTMPALRSAVEAINQSDFREKVKVMVGGAPITQEFADEIGADGYSEDAASAATLAKHLVGAC